MFWKKKKKHPLAQLELGLAVKRCSECGKHQRPCLVNGKPAIFHQWVVQDRALLKINAFYKPDSQAERYRIFKEEGIIPPDCSVEKVKDTLALIEWPDGSVSLEPVLHVHFIDREG